MRKEDIRILIGCEKSGIVRDAFRALGFDAWSCDIQKCDRDNEFHLQCDVMDALLNGYDLAILFPPCTHLSGAGAPSWKQKQADGRQQVAFEFVMKLNDFPIPHMAIENPTGYLNTHWRKPDQIIHPYQFGDPFMKRTCLWLRNLPLLKPVNEVKPVYHYTSNSTRAGKLKDGSRRKSKLPVYKAWDNSDERSKSFEGIATAMATQWGDLLLSTPQPTAHDCSIGGRVLCTSSHHNPA